MDYDHSKGVRCKVIVDQTHLGKYVDNIGQETDVQLLLREKNRIFKHAPDFVLDALNKRIGTLNQQKPKRIFRGKIFNVIEMPDTGFQVVEHPGAAAILPIMDDGRIVMVTQLRPARPEEFIEIPAGLLDKSESSRACALRELMEETGYAVKSITHLTRLYPSPGCSQEHVDIYAGLGAYRQTDETDGEVKTELWSMDDLLSAIICGDISNGIAIASILFYNQWKDQLTFEEI